MTIYLINFYFHFFFMLIIFLIFDKYYLIFIILFGMTFKRRNHGRCKNHAGRCRPVHCDNCSKLVPADKITRRFTAKQIIDANIAQDVM